MSEYKGIKGFQVQTRTEDPVPYAQALADNPYAGVWGAGGNLNNARFLFDSGVGSLTAGLVAGNSPSPNAETYNGTSWTNISSLGNNTAGRAGAGTSTAALEFGGTPGLGVTEYWNGSSWTELNDLNTGRNVAGGIGTAYTAALCAGGDAPGYVANVESWDGTNWTEVNDLNTARGHIAGVGTQTSAIVAGSAPSGDLVETWDGSSWTEVAELNTGRYGLSGSGASRTDALMFGGTHPSLPNHSANTESWNGSTWTEVNDMATARYYLAGAGSSSSAWAAGGIVTTASAATEEWTFSGLDPSTTPSADYADAIVGDFYYNSTTGQFKTVNDGGAPIGSWASGGNLNQVRGSNKGFGTQTAAIDAGGVYSPISPPGAQSNYVESYDGTSWTEVAEMNTARQAFASAGTQTAGIIALGYKQGSNAPETELWNGSTWTETADANTARTSVRGCGTTTAALAVGGYNPPPSLQLNITESWNGSAWTEVNDMNTRRSGAGIALSSPYTDTIIFGGYSQPPPNTANAETWNGSSWTETGNLNTAKDNMGGSGDSSTSALCFGGRTLSQTEGWNGTAWTEVSDLALARGYLASAGSATSALASGGEAPGSPYYRNNTEEWNAADFQIKSVTTS